MHTYIHTQCMHIYIYTCIHTCIHGCIHIYIHAYIHTCIYTYIMRACVHIYMCVYMYACMYTYTYTFVTVFYIKLTLRLQSRNVINTSNEKTIHGQHWDTVEEFWSCRFVCILAPLPITLFVNHSLAYVWEALFWHHRYEQPMASQHHSVW